MSLIFTVRGTPAPQGSKRAFNHAGRVVMVESGHDRVRTWREDVKHAALDVLEAERQPMKGPVAVDITFYFPRPKAHYRTGKLAHLLRDNAPHYVTRKPDIDKLLRSTLDALTIAGVWTDDSQVVRVATTKRYHDKPGADITVKELRNTPGDEVEAA